jgi:hypothetical protein
MTARLDGMLDVAVRKVAFAVEAKAKQLAPVDTGALKNSIHTVTSKSSGYAKAKAAVERRADTMAKRSLTGKNAGKRAFNASQSRKVWRAAENMFPEVGPKHPHEAVVAVGVEYGGPVEFGLGSGRNPNPYLRPALEAARPMLEAAIDAAISKAGA